MEGNVICHASKKEARHYPDTSSVAWQHHNSNSAKPALTYSPLLNVQHSRRSRRLQTYTLVKGGNLRNLNLS